MKKPLLNSVNLKIKRAMRKGHAIFLVFHFKDLKSVSIDSAASFG